MFTLSKGRYGYEALYAAPYGSLFRRLHIDVLGTDGKRPDKKALMRGLFYLVDPFTDVRELQRQLKAQGVELINEADEKTTGPASFLVLDPDGNPILIDQHR